jgi:hypothetical protein
MPFESTGAYNIIFSELWLGAQRKEKPHPSGCEELGQKEHALESNATVLAHTVDAYLEKAAKLLYKIDAPTDVRMRSTHSAIAKRAVDISGGIKGKPRGHSIGSMMAVSSLGAEEPIYPYDNRGHGKPMLRSLL